MRCLPVPVAAMMLAGARLLFAACDPGSEPDRTDIAAVRANIEANYCHCAPGGPGFGSHFDYVRCVRQMAGVLLQNKSCVRAVARCASRSTCGRIDATACCRTSLAGTTRCSIRPTTACLSTPVFQRCASDAVSCCDACSATGCETTTTTTTTTTASCPPTTAFYCGGFGGTPSCESFALCPAYNMRCDTTTCSCVTTGPPVPCADAYSGVDGRFCGVYSECPPGLSCVAASTACFPGCTCQ